MIMNNGFILRIISFVACIGMLAYGNGKDCWDIYIDITGVILAVMAAIIAYEG